MADAATVLIADQDQSVVRLLKTVLGNAGHRVLLAETPEAVLAAVDEGSIDVALIDDGHEGRAGIDGVERGLCGGAHHCPCRD